MSLVTRYNTRLAAHLKPASPFHDIVNFNGSFLAQKIRLQYGRALKSSNFTPSKSERKTESTDAKPEEPTTKALTTTTNSTSKQLTTAPELTKEPDISDFPRKSESFHDHVATTAGASVKSKFTHELVRQNVKGYVFSRYFDYVKNYDKVLEKKFPRAIMVYRVFFDGLKDFYADMKRYLKISRIINDSPEGLRALNRQELELYMQMPRDMLKVAPALIGSSLPMVGYAFFPIIFMFPRTFLTAHFWTINQRTEFRQLLLQERFSSNRSIFRALQAKLKTITNECEQQELDNIFGLLGSGFHPNPEALLSVKEVFAKPPYNLLSLSRKHIKLLCQLHGIPIGIFKRYRLTEHAFLVHHMDLAIRREGGEHNMFPDALHYSCYIRGLNPTNLSREEMVEWLRNWIHISTNIEEQHISLFLHLPIFLGYNHPNNWKLIYEEKVIVNKAEPVTKEE